MRAFAIFALLLAQAVPPAPEPTGAKADAIAYAKCGPDGTVDWDPSTAVPPPHCNRDGWDGHRYRKVMAVRVLDGDTIVVGREHIRLLGIDAPEMPGHCRTGRDCAPGDPFQSKAMLEAAVTGAKLVIHRTAKDRYGRTVADVFANGTSLSCRQLAAGQARYWARYDNRGRVAKECPDLAR